MPDHPALSIDPARRIAWAQADVAGPAQAGERRASPARDLTRAFSAIVNLRSARLRKIRSDLSSPAGRLAGLIESMISDHGWVRALYWNFHQVAPGVYRSAQPSPRHLERAARLGIRTVVNLRGERDCATYIAELAACRRLGLDLIDFPMRSNLAASAERLAALCELFAVAPRPLLLHCKSGADRSGFASAVCLLHLGRPVQEARAHLALRYGHLRHSRAGILDLVLDDYLAAQRQSGLAFQAWIEHGYDPAALMEAFNRAGPGKYRSERLLDPE